MKISPRNPLPTKGGIQRNLRVGLPFRRCVELAKMGKRDSVGKKTF